MKILLIHRYFWPDTPPYASMLRVIGKKMSDAGHEVFILSTQPSYKKNVFVKKQPSVETIDGMSVYRIHLFREYDRHVVFRLFNIFYFCIRIFLFCITREKFSVVTASTAPPVVIGFATAVTAKITGASFFYHCMDIHPEIGRISGEFSNPIIFFLLKKIDAINCRIAKKIIVLSEDMKETLIKKRSVDHFRIEIINNFAIPCFDNHPCDTRSLLKLPGRFRIIFAGNLGRFQGLDIFIEAMKKLTHNPMIEMAFVGEGSELKSLQKKAHGMKNIHFFPHQNVDVVRNMIADSDIGVVSLRKEMYHFAFPSKVMTYLAEGCPLLAIIESKSNLADLIKTTNIGIQIDHGRVELIVSAIESLFADKQKIKQMKDAAQKIEKQMFSSKHATDIWLKLLEV